MKERRRSTKERWKRTIAKLQTLCVSTMVRRLTLRGSTRILVWWQVLMLLHQCRARTAPLKRYELHPRKRIPVRCKTDRRMEQAGTVIELFAVRSVPAYNEDYRFAGLLGGRLFYIWPPGVSGQRPEQATKISFWYSLPIPE